MHSYPNKNEAGTLSLPTPRPLLLISSARIASCSNFRRRHGSDSCVSASAAILGGASFVSAKSNAPAKETVSAIMQRWVGVISCQAGRALCRDDGEQGMIKEVRNSRGNRYVQHALTMSWVTLVHELDRFSEFDRRHNL